MSLEGLYGDMKDVWAQTVCMWMSDAKLEGERIEARGRDPTYNFYLGLHTVALHSPLQFMIAMMTIKSWLQCTSYIDGVE